MLPPTPEVAPYGSWKSPITAEMVAESAVRLGEVFLDGDTLYWIEMRPEEGGRNIVVRRLPGGEVRDVTPAAFNARTRVHEYGGGAFLVHDGVVFFSNDADQRLYRQPVEEVPTPITPEGPYRYADGVFDPYRNRIVCVREDHRQNGNQARNEIVSVAADGATAPQVLVTGNDFYAAPRLSPDGRQLAWLTWNHPNMPWDGTELWLADVAEDGTLTNLKQVAGGADESVFQPEWSPDGTLYFVSDRSGWWNLYRLANGSVEPLLPRSAEFGVPQWVFGLSTYAFYAPDALVCTFFEEGRWKLARFHPDTRELEIVETPFTEIDHLRAGAGRAVFVAGSPVAPRAVVSLDLESGQFEIVRRAAELKVESTFFSRPEPIEFPTEGGQTAYAYFYAPQNRDFEGPENERPPLIVKSHGGPTSASSNSLDLKIQFWTSRGFAVLDVNYGGSTGYGRAYRKRLEGKWGIVDVDDCVNAARFVAERGWVDEQRVAITGGSAGGYTTLAALTFRDYFKAGSSYYGISDLEALARDTHKFESRYLDRMIGPYPEGREVYRQRSPIHFTDKLSSPIILFQGLEDKVVPPNQAEMMVAAARKKGLPVAYLTFEGEQHGFRKAETIKRALEAELYFYSRIFEFEPADRIEPIPIENLDEP